MEQFGLPDLGTPKVLLAAVHTILGAARAVEGMEGLGFSLLRRIPTQYSPQVKAGVQITCGILHIAAALLLGRNH